jgi:putative PIG3 family NAD(P)H quinone oxidoreductase
MLAIKISQPGGPEVLKPVERPVPVPGPGEVLVRVHAAGVNRPDILQRLGRYPPPPGASPDIPGLEIAGQIAAVGQAPDGVQPRWQVGDAVCALVSGGGYAEYCVVPEPQCLPVPAPLGYPAAAAVPETYFTVWTNLFQRAHLRAGETLLVHGGSSGIGTTAIQLAHAAGATVYATAGSREKCAACERLGAAHAINYQTMDFVQAISELTSGRGVDIILDIVGAPYLPRNIECLAVEGRLVQIGLLGGATSSINLSPLMQKRLTLTGSTLRIRSVEQKGAIARELEQHVWPLLAAGRVAPIVHGALPLTKAAEAHRLLESGAVIGKLVLLTDAPQNS